MASSSYKNSLLVARYAGAFIDLAEDSGLIGKVEKDLAGMEAMITGSADLQALLKNPLIGRHRKKEAVMALAEKAGFQDLTARFLGTVADNGRLAVLPAIIESFRTQMRTRRGEIEARVETAFALTPAQTKQLQEELGRAMGSQVTLNVTVNKDIMGGLIITVGSHMIDDSVRRKLERLEQAMSKGTQQSQMKMKEVG